MPTRPTKPAHYSFTNTRLDFTLAIAYIQNNPDKIYTTIAGNNFTAHVATTSKGRRKGELVIIFKQNNKEYARAYSCCWGHITNCHRTYIDSYSTTIG